MPGGFDPDKEPFAKVSCMSCGYVFTKEEYLDGQAASAERQASGHHVEDIRQGRP